MTILKILSFLYILLSIFNASTSYSQETANNNPTEVTQQQDEGNTSQPGNVKEKPDFSELSNTKRRKYEARYNEMSTNDADGDGAMNLEELKQRGKSQTELMDLNKDGVVDKTEIEAYSQKYFDETMADPDNKKGDKIIERRSRTMIKNLKKMDLDRDGIITAEETEEFQQKMLDKRDKNGDGKLTIDEYKSEIERRHNKKKKD